MQCNASPTSSQRILLMMIHASSAKGRRTETAEHLLLFCPFSAALWQRLGIQVTLLSANCSAPHPETKVVCHCQRLTWRPLFCYAAGQLWRRRNGIVLRQKDMSMMQFMQGCKSFLKKKKKAVSLTHRFGVAVCRWRIARLAIKWCRALYLAM